MYKDSSNLLIVSEVQYQTSFWEIHAVKFNWKCPKPASQYYSTALTITWYLGLQEWEFSWCSPLFQWNLLRLDCPENLHTGQCKFSQHFLILQHFNAMSRWPQGIWGTSATAGLFQCNFGNRKFAKLLCIGGVSSCNLDFLLPGTSIEELGKGGPVAVTENRSSMYSCTSARQCRWLLMSSIPNSKCTLSFWITAQIWSHFLIPIDGWKSCTCFYIEIPNWLYTILLTISTIFVHQP